MGWLCRCECGECAGVGVVSGGVGVVSAGVGVVSAGVGGVIVQDHFLVTCTTLPSHIEIPFPIYILPTLIHKIALYTLCCSVYEIWSLAI